MNEKTEHTDLFDRPINVGDYIIYSASADRSSVLRVGQVLGLKFGKPDWNGDVAAKVLCKSWNNFRSEGFSWEDAGIERSGRQKNVTLGFLTRVVVVDPSTISDKIKRDLDGPICDYRGLPVEGSKK
jgi:hypothetical protein